MLSPCGEISENSQKFYVSLGKIETNEKGTYKTVAFKQKDGEEIKNLSAVSGDVSDIGINSFKWQGQTITKLQVTFSKKGDPSKTMLQCGIQSAFARNVLNRMASLKTFDNIRIAPFIYSFEVDGELKEITCGSVKQFGEVVPLKYKGNEIPKTTQVITNKRTGQTTTDSSDRDEFYDKVLKDIQTAIHKFKDSKPSIDDLKDIENETSTEPDYSEDVPF